VVCSRCCFTCRERGSGAGGAHGGAGLGATHLGCFLELGPTILEPNFHLERRVKIEES